MRIQDALDWLCELIQAGGEFPDAVDDAAQAYLDDWFNPDNWWSRTDGSIEAPPDYTEVVTELTALYDAL